MEDNTTTTPEPTLEDNIRSCGSVGFSWLQTAIALNLDKADVKKQFATQSGKVYDLYMEGRYQHELEIRQAVLQSAKNGSTPAQQQMLEFFATADSELRDIEI